ncbi:sodium channel subunit beta-4-like isoform X2 [Rhincodon typus]|uniref:sodium channel subunit beta-4-like isoform X2 n=1 Tax=Rhincodon typus TaxID=259920 RepID=UPI00202E9787|nr:sodium channel subunit beta-4-like isoform X2 [Rhincodon typus]
MDVQKLQGHISLKLLPLLLNVVAAVPGDSPVLVSGFTGEQVVLPCTYKGNVPVSDLWVMWRTLEDEVLCEFFNGNDDLRKQEPQFRNRTNLFKDQLEHGNWSVLISDLGESDQDEYQCWIQKRMGVHFSLEHSDFVYLFVRERAATPGLNTTIPGPGVPTRGRVGLGIGIAAIIVIFIAIGVYVVLNQKRDCAQNRHSNNRNEALNGVPLSEVSCSGEARSLVPTAPEHQDGVAGEQNLLGNGAVQY